MANDSTQRKQRVTLSAKTVNEIVFPDTKPNHIYINSYGAGKLYLSMTGIPSPTRFDLFVDSFGSGIYGQENGVTRVLIYNDGTDPVDIDLTSFEAPFNPLILAKSVPVSNGGGGGGGVASNVTIQGFSAPLPSGSNNIGKVEVTSMPAVSFQLDELPPGSNNIGKVDVNTLPPLAYGDSHIGRVTVENGVTIDTMPAVVVSSMPPVQLTNDPVKQSHEYFEGTVGTTEVVYDMGSRTLTKISYIANDDPANDLYVSFDDTPATASPVSGANGVIHMLPGETITELGRKCSKIRFIRSVSGGNVRMLGV
jgi:hypothetical protein